MVRKPQKPNPALDALCDRRDHLLVQINLMTDAPGLDSAELAEMAGRLRELERQIDTIQRKPYD